TTANDVPERDPASYQMYGLQSGSWQMLSSGSLQLPAARYTDSAAVVMPSLPALMQYRLIFPTLKGTGTMMQIADLKLSGSQSSAPANTSGLRIQSPTQSVAHQGSDGLIAYGGGDPSEAQSALLTLEPQADGIIRDKGRMSWRETSWPGRPSSPQRPQPFTAGLRPVSNPVPLTGMATTVDQHHWQKAASPLVAPLANPWLQA
ncbi:MAG: hypothetical protein VKO19_02790, partial [Cyanobacteriota bacterium]|nr:hypothetical protein [Cyanobacteriota bacterium]